MPLELEPAAPDEPEGPAADEVEEEEVEDEDGPADEEAAF